MKFLLIILFIGSISSMGHSQLLSKSDSFPHHLDSGKDSGLYTSVEILAEFPGGGDGWINFLSKNLKNKVPGRNGAPAGKYTVTVMFIVDKDGSVTGINIKNDPGYGTAEEVIRVLKKSPKWSPGIQNGNRVKSWRTQNITFQVE